MDRRSLLRLGLAALAGAPFVRTFGADVAVVAPIRGGAITWDVIERAAAMEYGSHLPEAVYASQSMMNAYQSMLLDDVRYR